MATQFETQPLADKFAQWGVFDECPGDLASVASLMAALTQTLLAAHRLLAALEKAAGHHARAATHLTAAQALAGKEAARGECVPTSPYPTSGTLSRREREVLHLLAAGGSNRQVAQVLSLSPRTVQRHIANAYLKIGAHNKAEATAYALRHGLA